jgi:hypothetical protein
MTRKKKNKWYVVEVIHGCCIGKFKTVKKIAAWSLAGAGVVITLYVLFFWMFSYEKMSLVSWANFVLLTAFLYLLFQMCWIKIKEWMDG